MHRRRLSARMVQRQENREIRDPRDGRTCGDIPCAGLGARMHYHVGVFIQGTVGCQRAGC